MSNRAPLALVYIAYLKEWRAVQTARSSRGLQAEAVIYLREPTAEEKSVLEQVCLKTDLHFHLGDLLLGAPEEALSAWAIPLPTGDGAPIYTGYRCIDCDGFGTRPVHPGTDDTDGGECHRCKGAGWTEDEPSVQWEVDARRGSRAALRQWAYGDVPAATLALVKWRDQAALDWWGEELVSHIEHAFQSPVRPIPEEHQEAYMWLMALPEDERSRMIKRALMAVGSY